MEFLDILKELPDTIFFCWAMASLFTMLMVLSYALYTLFVFLKKLFNLFFFE
jgi:hypothetical protein